MTNASSRIHEHEHKQMKEGDRIWIWLAAPPSDFEKSVASQLREHQCDNGVFFVRAFSWTGPTPNVSDVLGSDMPERISLPQDRFVSFFHISGTMDVSIPHPSLTFSNNTEAGSITITDARFHFHDQTLLLLSCCQHDQDADTQSLKGVSDILGLLSLMFGDNILSQEVFSSYFCVRREKFISGKFVLRRQSPYDQLVVGLQSFFKMKELSIEEKTIHAALWFAGRAFATNDNAAKMVYYNTSLELLAGKNLQNYFGHVYRNSEFRELAINKIKEIQSLRNELVHKGEPIKMKDGLEREIQFLLLDAIVYKQQGSLSMNAFGSFYRSE